MLWLSPHSFRHEWELPVGKWLSVSGTELPNLESQLPALFQEAVHPSERLPLLWHFTFLTGNQLSHSRVPVKAAGTLSPLSIAAPRSTRRIFQIPVPVPGFPVFPPVHYQFQLFCNRIWDGGLISSQAKTHKKIWIVYSLYGLERQV